ncbi:MAG TPA: hypothetical protein VMM83_02670 [Longimicrobiales bacterium]|nr:hypothetical protein [Longimicrobiales bacterium]
MTDDPRDRADARLEQALKSAAIRDPRPHLRPILKHLKERDPAAYDRALSHLEATLIPAVAADADPLAAWLEYGRLLTRLAGAGQTMAIDGTGRAAPVEKGVPDGALVLYLPDAAGTPAVVLSCPRETTPAQEASIALLVLGRVA